MICSPPATGLLTSRAYDLRNPSPGHAQPAASLPGPHAPGPPPQRHVGRLMVAPDLAGRGIGSALLGLIERAAPSDIERYVLFTGARSERNLRFYNRAGYTLAPPPPSAAGHIAGAVFMTKQRP
ncbi:GNAT family N-acetyltransferase [Microlunatus sp. GCM10028923]|uniref:GNAT family N-acetyltransferase n=1 Tax=Microlunatus sp. GCM10028923 TaxID=3273400 RepID=UPI00360E894E